MKKTAVNWLVKKLNLEGYDYTVEQAKEMEKEQKIKAQIDVLNELNDTHPLRINIMIRKLKEQLKSLTFKSE